MTVYARVPQAPPPKPGPTKGYLVGFSPHIYQHINPNHHAVLDALVKNQPLSEAAAEAGWSEGHVRGRIAPDIRKALHVDAHGTSEAWRVALVRLYYGIDRCWCQR